MRPATSRPPTTTEWTRRRVIATVLSMLATRAAAAPPAVGGDDLIGQNLLHRVIAGDDLVELALVYRVGYVELLAANPDVDPWLPGIGAELLIPGEHILPDAPRRGIVVNLAELRLYHFATDGRIASMPIGIGTEGTETPLGDTTIVNKRKDPTWWPPPSIRAEKPELPASVPPGPDNPLGAFALDLGLPLYRIHGTNRPYGVGRRVSHGCIRMYPDHIEALFAAVKVGTPVRLVDQPAKLGWRDGRLFLEMHPTQQQVDAVEAGGALDDWPPQDPTELIRSFVAASGRDVQVNWTVVDRIAQARSGVPGLISIGTAFAPE